MDKTYYIVETKQDEGVVVGRFPNKEERDEAFQKYFLPTGKQGFMINKW